MIKKRQTVKGTMLNIRGFTLIEIVAVLVIILILSAIAVSRSLSTNNELISQTDIVKSHLRFAQLKALQDDLNVWGITFTGGSYSLSCAAGTNSSCPASIQLPSESSGTHTFPTGVTSGTPTITYDSWGSPVGGAVNITLTQGSQTITLNVAAGTGNITP